MNLHIQQCHSLSFWGKIYEPATELDEKFVDLSHIAVSDKGEMSLLYENGNFSNTSNIIYSI